MSNEPNRENENNSKITPKESVNLALLIRQTIPSTDELDALWALNCKAFENRVSDYDFDDAKQKEKFINGLRNISSNPRGRVLVGIVDNNIVGLIALQSTKNYDIGEAIRLRVDPGYRRHGYGQRLMQELETQAKDLHYKKIIFGTGSRLEEANRIYQKLGYDVTSRTSKPEQAKKYGILYYEDIKYEKLL